MNDLPVPPQSGGISNPQVGGLHPKQDTGSTTSPTGTPQTGSFAKEKEVFGSIQNPEVPLKAVGTEVSLPKEVASAGVKIHPTVVPVPQPVAQMGVKAVSDNVAIQTTATSVVLPLSDDQIAQGLSQSIETSWRWLSEWCKRRLLKINVRLKIAGGHAVRENE